jgi:hypothetical protein
MTGTREIKSGTATGSMFGGSGGRWGSLVGVGLVRQPGRTRDKGER